MNIGANIVEAENLPRNIEKLSAQREIYTRAKEILLWQVILTVPITLFLAILKIFIDWYFNNPKISIEWLVSTYGLILFFIDALILNNLVKEMKEKAAGIQELFDCEVLSIEWNKMLFTEKPNNSDILKYHELRKARNIDDKFENWYAETIKEVPTNTAKLICQRENINYDMEVRRSLMNWVAGIAVSVLVVLCILSSISDTSFRSFITNVMTPFLPVFGLAIKWYFEQQNSIKTLKEIKSVTDGIWENVLEKGEEPNDTIIRQVQDRIHLHRKEGALVPDDIYNKIRTGREKQMYFSVNESVLAYKKSQQR